MTVPSALLAQYRLLCATTSSDSVEHHHMTVRYATRFHLLVADLGLRDARAWLLGTLIHDLHPDSNPHPYNPSSHLANPPHGHHPVIQ